MAHFALLWKARTIEKYRQNYENEKYHSIQETNISMPQKSLSQKLRCYRQDTQKRFSKIFHRIYPEGSSLSNFFQYLRTDQTCLHLVLKSLLGFLIGLGLTYLCFLFLVFQLSISLFHATIVSSIIGVLLTMGLAFSYRIRCLIFLLLPQFFSRAGRYTLTCYALVLILTGPATNTLKNSEVLTESMACRQEQIKTLLNEVKDTARRPLNAMRDSIKTMVQKLRLFARELKQTLLKVNRLTLSVLETIQSTFSWLQWLSGTCNKIMGSPFDRCLNILKEGVFDYKQRFERNKAEIHRVANKVEEVCSNMKHYRAICVFTDFVNGSFVASIRRRLKDYAERIRNLLYLRIHLHHSYSFSSNTSHSASQVAAGIVTEIRKRADPLLTWLSWSSYVTSLFLLLIIFRAKYYQHMFETRSRFDNKYITKELRDLDLNRLRHGRETILPLNKRERSKYVSTTSFRLVASEKIHLNRSIVFMAITTFKLLIHMIADYSLYWVLMTIRHHGKNQTPLPFGVPNAGMHMTGTGQIADMFRSLLSALTSPLERTQPSPTNCLPDPHPPNLQRYAQIGILIFLLWFFALFEPYGLRLRHVIMGLYRPERAKARAEWLYNHILRTRGGFMKFARRKLHRSYKYCSEEKYTLKRWLNEHIPFCWLRCLLGISKVEAHCLLCGGKQDPTDPNTKLQKCNTQGCPGVYCGSCFSDIGELCTICLSPSDYGDLSDVSLEKGTSDESDDDSGESQGGEVVPKNDDEINEQDMFDNDSDILLPKPLRDNKRDSNIMNSNEEHGKYKKTRLNKQSFDLTDKLSKTTKTYLSNNFTKKKKMWRENMITNKIITMTINSNWNVFKNTTMNIRIMAIKDINNNNIYVSKDNTEEDNNGTSCKEKHVKGSHGQDEQKSKKTQNRPVSKDIGERKDKGNSSDTLNEKSDKNKGIQRDRANSDDNIEQDNICNIEQKFPCCCLKQFNAVLGPYWLSIKNNLFAGCNVLTQAVINNTLGIDEKNNYKTRKKYTLEIPESNELKTDTEDSREYRIFTFLAEREWVIKKTIRHDSTENEISLINEKPDTKTVEHLKEDLYSQTVHYKEISFSHCTTSSLQLKRSEEHGQNQKISNELTSCNTSMKQHVLVCEDCKFNCLCPKNPVNVLSDVPVIRKKSDDKKIKPSNEYCTGPKPKKASVLEKIKACLKSLFSRKKGKVSGNTSKSRKPKKKYSAIMEKQKKIKCVCQSINQSIQFDENDCPCQNRSVQADQKVCYQSIVDKCDPLCPADCECKGHGLKPAEPCDPLCPSECECKGHGIKPAEPCDPLCPSECECKGHGIKPAEPCDPLCPSECECKGHGVQSEPCDPLCPIECQCNGQGRIWTKCNPLCPDDCTCKGCGSDIIKFNYNLRSLNNKSKTQQQNKRSADIAAQTKKAEKKFCSCAIQCIQPKYNKKECCRNSSCSSCTISIASDGTIRSDLTGTDNTCYACYDYYERVKRRRPRVGIITKHNQSTATDTAIKCNVGTITNEKGLIRRNRKILTENNSGGDVRVVDRRFTENRGVCTKKIVKFKRRVHIIPSYSIGSILDIYTPSRYLLESQKYYNELFAFIPHVYQIKAIQERTHKRISSQESRSTCRYRKDA